MTNNDLIKQDTTELFNMLNSYKRKYPDFWKKDSPIGPLERELRLILMVVRTDEENKKQREMDSYC